MDVFAAWVVEVVLMRRVCRGPWVRDPGRVNPAHLCSLENMNSTDRKNKADLKAPPDDAGGVNLTC